MLVLAVIVDSYYKAIVISNKILTGELPQTLNILKLTAIVREQIQIVPGLMPAGAMSWLTIAVVVIWAVAFADCCRLGKNLSRSDENTPR